MEIIQDPSISSSTTDNNLGNSKLSLEDLLDRLEDGKVVDGLNVIQTFTQ
jgi:hypothetical protein